MTLAYSSGADIIQVNNLSGSGLFTYNISELEPLQNGSNVSSSSPSISKTLAVPAAMFFFGVLGNVTALIILTVRPSKDSKATAFYHLVKALVYMDLFGIVATSPVTIIVYLNGGLLKTGGMALCHYVSFILVMAGNATLFTVLVMAAERFMVTKYPFKYSRIATTAHVNICIAVIWVLSSLIAILPIVGLGKNITPWPGTWCFFDYRGSNVGGQIYSYFYAIVGLLAITITIILNLTVIQHLWRMRKTRLITSSFRSNGQSSPSKGGSGPDSERRMVIFLMAIIIVFTICYAPLMFRILINQLFNTGSDILVGGADDRMDLWALRLAALNQIFDPWVYIISRVTCCKGPRQSDRDELNQSTRSYHTVHAANSPTQERAHNAQNNRIRGGRIARTLQNVRYLFNKTKIDARSGESVTLALKSKPTQKIITSSYANGSNGSLASEDSHLNPIQNGGSGNCEHV